MTTDDHRDSTAGGGADLEPALARNPAREVDRSRLAQLIGRLLARHWLRSRRAGRPQLTRL